MNPNQNAKTEPRVTGSQVDPPEFPIPRYAMLDVWMALGGDSRDFEAWMDDPKRTPADAWAQLTAAIRGDLMPGDTNPEPGAILALVWKREVEA